MTTPEFTVGVSQEVNEYLQSQSFATEFTRAGLTAVQAEGRRYFMELAKKSIDLTESDSRSAVDRNEVNKAIKRLRRGESLVAFLYALASFLGGIGGTAAISALITPDSKAYNLLLYGGIAIVALGLATLIFALKKK